MLSDTVGFISNLPTQLVAAFRATLEEVLEADVILHVRDISHEDAEAQQSDVDAVLRQLGIDPDDRGRIIEVWNKIDRYDSEQREELLNIAARQAGGSPGRCWSPPCRVRGSTRCSPRSRNAWPPRASRSICRSTPPTAPASRWLHRNSEVLAKELHDGRFDMTVRVGTRPSGISW